MFGVHAKRNELADPIKLIECTERTERQKAMKMAIKSVCEQNICSPPCRRPAAAVIAQWMIYNFPLIHSYWMKAIGLFSGLQIFHCIFLMTFLCKKPLLIYCSLHRQTGVWVFASRFTVFFSFVNYGLSLPQPEGNGRKGAGTSGCHPRLKLMIEIPFRWTKVFVQRNYYKY